MSPNKKFKTKSVDFKTLSSQELTSLQRKWSMDAIRAESKYEAAVRQNKPQKDLQDLHDSANRIWKRIYAANRHIVKKKAV